MERAAIIYYAIINIATAAVYYADKRYSKMRHRRVPEKVLLLLAFLGGGVGAFFSMQVFRHKTKKPKFIISVPMAIILHMAVWYGVLNGLIALG